MKRFQKGDRVAALQWLDIQSAAPTVELAGFGTYLGRVIPDDDNVTFMGISLLKNNLPTACAQLDNGFRVYATEVAFVREETAKHMLKNIKNAVNVDTDLIKQRRQEQKYKQLLSY